MKIKSLRRHCFVLLWTFLAALFPAVASADSPKPEAPQVGRASYSGDWKYRVVVTLPGYKSEGVFFELCCKGKPLAAPQINDFAETPWGKLYWTGGNSLFISGWLSQPNKNFPDGKLRTPEELAATPNPNAMIGAPLKFKSAAYPEKGKSIESGRWKLNIAVRNPGTKSEGTTGEVFRDGKPITGKTVNDTVNTTWGTMYWQGGGIEDGLMLWHHWGWGPEPRKGYPQK